MRDAYLCLSVDDVGLDVFSSEPDLSALLDFYAAEKVRATFFVVPLPEGRGLAESKPGYAPILRRALEEGHELAQHGLEHTRFQTGVPPKMILDLPHEGPAREELAKHRTEIEARLSVQELRATLRKGRDILKSILGVPVEGFRAPCLSVCDNLFAALEQEGYLYDSSKCLQPTAWDILNGRPETAPAPIDRARFDASQGGGKMRTLPLTGEYTWYLKRESYAACLELAKHDFRACLDADIPFVPVCHVSPVMAGLGLDFHREFLGWARAEAARRKVRLLSTTMAEAGRRWPGWTSRKSR
jgi:peptidoglycan/xylan/chitin deacetylase (PgdA/CDA1 family)